MERFYKELKAGKTKAEAKRLAEIALLKDRSEDRASVLLGAVCVDWGLAVRPSAGKKSSHASRHA